MKSQSKYASAIQFLVASVFLFIGLFHLQTALTELENNFLAENWGPPLSVLLVIMFGLGWWSESFMESLLSKGQKTAIFVILGLLLIFGLVSFSSLVFIPLGFWRYTANASIYTLVSGFFFRFSVMHPEVSAKLNKLKERN